LPYPSPQGGGRIGRNYDPDLPLRGRENRNETTILTLPLRGRERNRAGTLPPLPLTARGREIVSRKGEGEFRMGGGGLQERLPERGYGPWECGGGPSRGAWSRSQASCCWPRTFPT